MKKIYEYELKLELDGKKKTVQQSAYSAVDAQNRLRKSLPEAKNIRMVKRMSYPHMEGGKKVG